MHIIKRMSMKELLGSGLTLPANAGAVMSDTNRMAGVLAHLPMDATLQPAVAGAVKALWTSEVRFIKSLKAPERAVEAFYQAEAEHVAAFEGWLVDVLGHILSQVPKSATENGTLRLTVPLVSVLAQPSSVVDGIVRALLPLHVEHGVVHLGSGIAGEIEKKLCFASGVSIEAARKNPHRVKYPKSSKLDPTSLVEAYLGGTPFGDLLLTAVPLVIPDETRLAHMVCISGSGGGKSQMIGHLLKSDLMRPQSDPVGVVVLDSAGDLYQKITRLKPLADSDRLLMINVEDSEALPSLNLFGLDQGRNYQSEIEWEQSIESTIHLTEYVIAGMMDNDFTSNQLGAFRFLVRLILSMPGSTLLTLQDVLDSPTSYVAAMERMQGVTRAFFEKQFLTKTYGPTRVQISRRVQRLLSNRTFERMFSASENRLDLGRALDQGRVVAVNTSRAALKDGCGVFGRFILASVLQAGFARARLPYAERRPAFVLIDEASEYIDETLPQMLEQVRKYKIGVAMFMQSGEQMSHEIRARVQASTAIKLAGFGSDKDARALAGDLHCHEDFILSQVKDAEGARFATYVRGLTPAAVSWHVPFGALDSLGEMSEEAFAQLQARNREEISVQAPSAPEPAPKPIRKFFVPKK